MRLVGNWFRFQDGETRPILRAKLRTGTGTTVSEQFLVDSGADRTVFSASLLEQLHLVIEPPPMDLQLRGVSGSAAFAIVESVIEFARADGGTARIRGKFAAFTDPTAIDVSVLGRDVLNHFDVILSRKNDEVVLLAERHRYQIVAS